LELFVPSKLIPDLLRQSDIRPGTPMSQLQKWQRNKLIENLKAFQVGQVREVVLPKGEVVAGGVSLDEVDPHTMRSLKTNGLYLAGEVLDIAGPVGGYNLQAAFATGFVAGESAARAAMDASHSS
jgi:predicted flavoprotein YhiN